MKKIFKIINLLSKNFVFIFSQMIFIYFEKHLTLKIMLKSSIYLKILKIC